MPNKAAIFFDRKGTTVSETRIGLIGKFAIGIAITSCILRARDARLNGFGADGRATTWSAEDRSPVGRRRVANPQPVGGAGLREPSSRFENGSVPSRGVLDGMKQRKSKTPPFEAKDEAPANPQTRARSS